MELLWMLNPEPAVAPVVHSLLLATTVRLSVNLLVICDHNICVSPNRFKCKCMVICISLAQNSHNRTTITLRYTLCMGVNCSWDLAVSERVPIRPFNDHLPYTCTLAPPKQASQAGSYSLPMQQWNILQFLCPWNITAERRNPVSIPSSPICKCTTAITCALYIHLLPLFLLLYISLYHLYKRKDFHQSGWWQKWRAAQSFWSIWFKEKTYLTAASWFLGTRTENFNFQWFLTSYSLKS